METTRIRRSARNVLVGALRAVGSVGAFVRAFRGFEFSSSELPRRRRIGSRPAAASQLLVVCRLSPLTLLRLTTLPLGSTTSTFHNYTILLVMNCAGRRRECPTVPRLRYMAMMKVSRSGDCNCRGRWMYTVSHCSCLGSVTGGARQATYRSG